MGKKFDKIFESVVQRYQAGGFLVGDYVKVKPSYKSTETYKMMHPKMQSDLDEMFDSGLNIQVTQIGDKMSGASAGNQFKTSTDTTITIAADHGGGRRYGQITLTPDMVELADHSSNDAPIPDEFKRKDKIIIKPEKFSPDNNNITRLTDKGNGKNTPTQLKLAGESVIKNDMANLATLWESSTSNN